MTGPETAREPEYATQAELSYLYQTAVYATIRYADREYHGTPPWPVRPNPELPYPKGVTFQLSVSGAEIGRFGNENLRHLSQAWDIRHITFQYMTEHLGLMRSQGVEVVPASLAILVERNAGTEDHFLIENRLVDGEWMKITDRLDDLPPNDDLMKDQDLRLTRQEVEDLSYLAAHAARLGHRAPGE